MKLTAKILSIILAAALFLQCSPAAFAQEIIDNNTEKTEASVPAENTAETGASHFDGREACDCCGEHAHKDGAAPAADNTTKPAVLPDNATVSIIDNATESDADNATAKKPAGERIGETDLYWELNDGTLHISGSGDCPAFTSKDSQPWAEVREQIISVSFDGEIYISNLAYWFEGCVNLKSVSVPFVGCTIGTRAFAGCTALTSVTVYTDSIADDAFSDCPAKVTKAEAKKTEAEKKKLLTGTRLGSSNFCQNGEHNYNLVSSTPATCTSGGVQYYSCYRCGATRTSTSSPLATTGP